MTHLDKGKFAKKHPPERRPIPEVTDAVQERAEGNEIGCAAAFEIAAEKNVSPSEVGLAIDCLEVTIVRCQLGLFGYPPKRSIVEPAASVDPGLEAAIRSSLVDGRLPCASAWRIAGEQGVSKMAVSSACEALGIKISSCQLGAF